MAAACRWRTALLLAVLLLAGAAAPALAWEPPAIALDPAAPFLLLDGRMAALSDPGGLLAAADILAAAPERFAHPGPLDKGGFTTATEWRVFTLANPTVTAQTRLIVVERRSLNFVDLHIGDGQGGFRHERAGILRPFAMQSYPDRNFTFRVSVAAGASIPVLLAVRTAGAMVINVAAWDPDAYFQRSRGETLIGGLLHGAALIVVVLTAVVALVVRERIVWWFLLHIASTEMVLLFFGGILHQWLAPQWPLLATSGLYAGLTIGLGAGFLFVHAALDPERRRPWMGWLFRGLALSAVAAMIGGLSGHYERVAPFINALVLVFVLLPLAMIWTEVWRGRHHLALMGIGFLVVAASIILRVGQNFRLPLPSEITSWSIQVGFSGYALILVVAVVAHFNRTRDFSLKMTHRLLEATERREHILDAMVHDRTVELQASLETQRQIVAEQRNFLSMVSHEFKTPMSIVLAAASNLSSGRLDRAESDEEVDSIVSAIHRMQMLVEKCLADDWLDHGAQAAQHLPVEVIRLMNEVIEAHQTAFPGRAIDWTPPPAPATVGGDEMLLRVMLSNVLENAGKYSPAAVPVAVTLSVAAGFACLRISDCGPGIAPEERERVFEKFYRSPRAQRRPGAGLGLYIVRKIALLHGGTATVEEKEGPGSTFVMRLPTIQ